MPTEYFIDPRDYKCNGNTNYNVSNGQVVSAIAFVTPYADSVEVYAAIHGTR